MNASEMKGELYSKEAELSRADKGHGAIMALHRVIMSGGDTIGSMIEYAKAGLVSDDEIKTEEDADRKDGFLIALEMMGA